MQVEMEETKHAEADKMAASESAMHLGSARVADMAGRT